MILRARELFCRRRAVKSFWARCVCHGARIGAVGTGGARCAIVDARSAGQRAEGADGTCQAACRHGELEVPNFVHVCVTTRSASKPKCPRFFGGNRIFCVFIKGKRHPSGRERHASCSVPRQLHICPAVANFPGIHLTNSVTVDGNARVFIILVEIYRHANHFTCVLGR